MNLGIIGAGKMAAAIAKGAIESGALASTHVHAVGRSESSRAKFQEITGIEAGQNASILSKCSVFLLAVKPGDVTKTLEPITPYLENRLLISVAAGVSLSTLETAAKGARVVRTMPNTPCAIGHGVIASCSGNGVSAEDEATVDQLFQPLGCLIRVKEEQMHAVTALSGSGPAYFFLMIVALADAGVRQGLPRDTATKMAVQTAVGAALLARSENTHIAELRDRVTSPGGTTIAAIEALEKNGLRFAIFEAVEAAAKRSKELSVTGK